MRYPELAIASALLFGFGAACGGGGDGFSVEDRDSGEQSTAAEDPRGTTTLNSNSPANPATSATPSSPGAPNPPGTPNLPGNAGGGPASPGTSSPEDVCRRGCVKIDALNCPNDPPDCATACMADYLDYPAACRSLVLEYGECAADRPVSDFLCDEEGVGSPRDGICEAESLAAATCLLNLL